MSIIAKDHKGKLFDSIFDMARAHHLPPSVVWQRINNLGWTIEKALTTKVHAQNTKHADPIEYRGKTYRSKKRLAFVLNVPYTRLLKGLKKGLSIEQIKKKGRQYHKIIYNGKNYNSASSFAKDNNLYVNAVYQELKNGTPIEKIVKNCKKRGK